MEFLESILAKFSYVIFIGGADGVEGVVGVEVGGVIALAVNVDLTKGLM